jgi:hypothetical protein
MKNNPNPKYIGSGYLPILIQNTTDRDTYLNAVVQNSGRRGWDVDGRRRRGRDVEGWRRWSRDVDGRRKVDGRRRRGWIETGDSCGCAEEQRWRCVSRGATPDAEESRGGAGGRWYGAVVGEGTDGWCRRGEGKTERTGSGNWNRREIVGEWGELRSWYGVLLDLIGEWAGPVTLSPERRGGPVWQSYQDTGYWLLFSTQGII